MGADAAVVQALCEKYREIRALRVEHAAGEAADPRPRMRALAQRFPGSLRELDELPMERIEARLAALEGALEAGPPYARWIELQHAYHSLFAAALRVKRLARGRRGAALDAVMSELAAEPAHAGPPLDRAAVAHILAPPGGRLGPWVVALVAAQLEVHPDDVRVALFVR